MANGSTADPPDPVVERLEREAAKRKFELDFVTHLAAARNRKKRNPKAEGFLEAAIGPRSLLRKFHTNNPFTRGGYAR